VNALVSPWLERYAAGMLWVSAAFSFAHQAWSSVFVCASCAGIVSGMAIFRWIKER